MKLHVYEIHYKRVFYVLISIALTPPGVWVDDEGVYVCEAKNQFGSIKALARVTVTGLGMKMCCSPYQYHKYCDHKLVTL